MIEISENMDNHLVLKDVVAYVEVRSGNDNRSAAISQELKQLGAHVESTFTDAVTHVVFKEGLKRTWSKAVKRKVHLVSVSWIDSCKQNQLRVSEANFSAVLPEEIASPLPRINQAVRWKKMKSMQPCDFDEELARSAERGEKKRKRIMMANRFALNEEATPTFSSPIPVLAFETQARRSPLFAAVSRANSPVPDTPPSMQERLEKMRREQRQVLGTHFCDSPPATPKGPADVQLQRRILDMFAGDFISTGSSNDEDEAASRAVAELIHDLDSNSECGSQQSTHMKDGSTSGYTLAPVSACPPNRCREMTTDTSKRTKTQASQESSVCNSLSGSTDHSLSANMHLRNTASKSRRSQLLESTMCYQKRRSISNALSPKDTNIGESSLNVKSTEIQQTIGQMLPLSKSILEVYEVSCQPNDRLDENMSRRRGNKKISVKDGMENETKMIGSQLDGQSRRQSVVVKSGQVSCSDLDTIPVSTEGRTCQPTVTLVQGSSIAPLKQRTTKKKRNLFTVTTLMCSSERTSRQTSSPPQNQTLRSDISFMFGTSTLKRTKQTRNTKASVGDLTGPNCLPKISSDKAAVENKASDCHGQKNSTSLGDSVLKNDMSMSVMYGSDMSSNITRAGYSRRSTDEFCTGSRTSRKVNKVAKISKALPDTGAVSTVTGKQNATKGQSLRAQGDKCDQKRKRSISSGSNSTVNSSAKKCKHDHHLSSSVDAESSFNESTDSHQDSITPARLRHAQSLVMEQKFQPASRRSVYSLVVTSLHREEQEIIYSVVRKLGIFHMTNNVEPTSTHVVCGELRRTLNVLRAVASGCWLLRKEWVLESLEAGMWLQEEPYEMTDLPAAVKSRTERQQVGSGYKVDLFSQLGAIFVSAVCTPPRKELVHLIGLCCGHITGSESRAAIHLGDDHSPTRLVIKPTWVLDCIMRLETLPIDGYMVHPRTSAVLRESSPEF